MSTHPKPFITPGQYLEIERTAERKSEYYKGEMFLMADASPTHVRITANLSRYLGNALADKPCFAYPADLRLEITASGLYMYPDILIACEPEQFSPDDPDSITNPTVIIEVLSPSTEGYDRGKKFGHYLQLPSLREYILVSQDEVRVDHFTIQPGQDHLFRSYHFLDDALKLPSISCSLSLRQIYEKTDLAG